MKLAKLSGFLPTLLLPALFLLACATSSGAPDLADTVAVHVSPVLAPDRKIEALRVEMRFRGDDDGRTEGRFQSGFADIDNLLETYTDIEVRGGILKDLERPGTWAIEAPPGAPITLSYLLRSGIDGPPTSKHRLPHAPWILDDWIYVFGQTTFARLQRPNTTPVTFEWSGPPDVVLASDLEVSALRDGKADLGDLRGGKLIAGRGVRILKDGGIRLAIHGQFDHPDERLFGAVTKIIGFEREFWGDQPDTPYLVTLGAVAPEPGTTGAGGGMGGGRSSGLAMHPDTPWTTYIYVLAHEIFHTWNWFQMGPPESIEDWFNEGVTDYYARTLPFRAGLLTIDEYAAEWNGVLLDYARTLITPDDGHAPYLRGGLMALIWDRRLRDASSGTASLDEAMREIRRRAAAGATVSPGTQLTRIAAEAGVDIKDEMGAHIEGGVPITVPSNAFGPCFQVDTVAIPTFDRGFDFEASAKAGMVATGVRTGGPAHAAGLRDGMRILQRVETHYPDSTREEVWIVQARGEPKLTLRWKPAGEGSLSIQRLVRVPGSPPDAKQCQLD